MSEYDMFEFVFMTDSFKVREWCEACIDLSLAEYDLSPDKRKDVLMEVLTASYSMTFRSPEMRSCWPDMVVYDVHDFHAELSGDQFFKRPILVPDWVPDGMRAKVGA